MAPAETGGAIVAVSLGRTSIVVAIAVGPAVGVDAVIGSDADSVEHTTPTERTSVSKSSGRSFIINHMCCYVGLY